MILVAVLHGDNISIDMCKTFTKFVGVFFVHISIINIIVLGVKTMKAGLGVMNVFQWHITHKCNLRCRHCYLDEYAKEPTLVELKQVLDRIVEYLDEIDGYGEIDLTGGEPFVSSKLFAILSLIEMQPRIKDVAIGTNGTLITEETVERLSKYKKLRAIQISIDGNKNTHDLIRGKGTFDASLKSIKLLKEHDIKTSISFTANRLNYKEFDEVASIVTLAGANIVWTDRVIPLGDKNKKDDLINNLVLTNEEFKEYIDIISNAANKYKTVSLRRPLQYLDTDDKRGHTCSAGRRSFTITADCELMPCRRLEETLGSVLDNSISQLLRINQKVIQQIHTIPDECKKCEHLNYCEGGSRCLACAVYGNYINPDPNCFIKE